ncbi:hypothetical protein [Bradyrhizobium australiense]|uniref:Uncharacterized protein n=1 Tax=Bradyrhizobium australiense TaxID=2721161 RepID=A0A7Y4LYS3_9BRAD|nr:hypothetical protein [Bradyrhizobium australiense]NOJ43892.1 hypothetical protein [Bradyrhizobium australiense]
MIDEPIPMFQLGDEGAGPLDRTTCLKTLFWLFAFVRCELDKRHDLAAFRHHQWEVNSNRRQFQTCDHAHGNPAAALADIHCLRGVALVIIGFQAYNLTQRKVQPLSVAWLNIIPVFHHSIVPPPYASPRFLRYEDTSDQMQATAMVENHFPDAGWLI